MTALFHLTDYLSIKRKWLPRPSGSLLSMKRQVSARSVCSSSCHQRGRGSRPASECIMFATCYAIRLLFVAVCRVDGFHLFVKKFWSWVDTTGFLPVSYSGDGVASFEIKTVPANKKFVTMNHIVTRSSTAGKLFSLPLSNKLEWIWTQCTHCVTPAGWKTRAYMLSDQFSLGSVWHYLSHPC